MDSVEADGSSIDEAIESALKLLGTTRDRVEVEILSSAARGLFGIGSRKARIRATRRKPLDATLAALETAPLPPTRNAVARSEQHTERSPTGNRPAAAVRAPSDRVVEQARDVLQQIVTLINVQAQVTVREEDDHVVLELTGDSSGVLIGRRGQMLDALEYVLNRIVARDEGGSTRIMVDSENYRSRRRTALEDLARRMGEQAKKKRRAVTLNPMSPRDRRIVHVMLQADSSLTTKSSGKGYYRRLIIIPAGATKPAVDEDERD